MNSESTLSDALSEVDTVLAASDNDRAAGLASELLLAYPNAVSVLRQRARALTAAGRFLQAAEVHRRVLEILPADGEAMAGLARTLLNAGQTVEAREAAQQALDYLPTDETLKRIASGDGQSFQPDESSMRLRKALAQTQVGMHEQGIASLRTIVGTSPDRIDAKVALMQALWRNGSRISAAEQAQTVLDDYPNCLNAHLLMLQMWHNAGASEMERAHQQAIEQVDPDHRVTCSLLGTQSPLQVKDVPARPAPANEPVLVDEDQLAREDWVQNLVAASLALPKPLEQLREVEAAPAIDEAEAEDAGNEAEVATDEVDFLSSFSPLEWSTASDLSEEESAKDDFTVPWLDGNAKDEFAPSRPRTAVPDPRDGVPAELDPLEWEVDADAPASTQKDFSTAVDGGAARLAEESSAKAADEETRSDNKPLKPLAAAGVIAAAKSKSDEKRDEDDETSETIESAAASASIKDDQPAATDYQSLRTAAPAALPESTPQQTPAESKATKAMNAEMESASIKPMPIDAVEFVDEDTDRWDDDVVDVIEDIDEDAEQSDDVEAIEDEAQPALSYKPLRPVVAASAAKAITSSEEKTPEPASEQINVESETAGIVQQAAEAEPLNVVGEAPTEAAPDTTANGTFETKPAGEPPSATNVTTADAKAVPASSSPPPQAELAASQSPSSQEPEDHKQNTVMKAVAAVTATTAAIKRHKKKSATKAEVVATPVEEKAVDENVAAVKTASADSTVITAAPAEALPEDTALVETEAVAPPAIGKPAKAGKTAKPKPVKKPAAKPATRETQTEKVRKTYERAIATAKREDMPKLIGELKQAAEVDPDNKIIFELLGQAYNRSGDIPAAINAYRKALELAEQS